MRYLCIQHVCFFSFAIHTHTHILSGDNMLSRGEQAFLSAFNKTNNMEECMYIQAGKRAPPCSAVLSRTNATLALWHAGGNWGDLYMSVHSKRMNSFVELLDHGMTIISMPQSLYYRNASLHREHANLMRRNIMKGLRLKDTTSPKNRRLIKSKVMFTWREQGSFDQAKRLYPFATNKLIPDIAFQIGPFQPIPPKNDTNKVDILVFLRADKESKFGGNGRSPGNIQRILNQIGKNVTFAVVDWIDRLKIFGTKNILFDETSIELLSLGKVVICDRLHAAILAYLSNLPVVYLDQESNKLTNVLNVAFSSSDICKDKRNMVIKSLSLQDSLEKAIEILATDGAGHGNVLKVAV